MLKDIHTSRSKAASIQRVLVINKHLDIIIVAV